MNQSTEEKILVTAALPYANGPLHIGHLAGVYIPADIYVRFQRLNGKKIVFIGGSDEHGVAITLRARKEGKKPQDIIDFYHSEIKKAFDGLAISFDNYSRTSKEIHYKTAQDFFKVLHEKEVLTTQTTEQYFDTEENQFLADRYIQGTCPNCGFEEAYGDQCESCGTTLSPRELINPVSKISGSEPILKETTHWYLPLDKYSDWLKEWIETKEDSWKTNVLGQVKSWLNEGLKPRAVTRDLDWGVPVPLENAEGKMLYVWFDAPIGYISSTKEWAEQNNENWEDYWKNENTKLVHFLAKDNIVFHSIIFPTMLKSHGDFILPENVPANEFLNLEDNKISTSRNWAIWANEYLEDFPNKQDVLRYVLAANMPETKDNYFTWKDFQTKNNSELVGIYGNFINRVLVLIQKYYGGEVPKGEDIYGVFEKISETKSELTEFIEKFEFRNALKSLMNLARFGNLFLQEKEPWKLNKTNPEEVENIMYASVQIVAALGYFSSPFMPFSSEKIISEFLNLSMVKNFNELSEELVTSGHTINKPSLLFEKIEDEQIENQLQKLNLGEK